MNEIKEYEQNKNKKNKNKTYNYVLSPVQINQRK